jgi:hypothetical protein
MIFILDGGREELRFQFFVKPMDALVDGILSHARKQGAWWESDAIEFVQRGEKGFGVFAKKNIPRGQVIFKFPLQLGIAPSGKIKQFCEQGKISNVIALVLTAMHGLHVETKKLPYFEYLSASNPPRIGHCWNDDEKQYLKGTSLFVDDANQGLLNLRKIYEKDIAPLLKELGPALFPKSSIQENKFFDAFAWVFSRALMELPPACKDVPFQGPILLPIFDMINHTSRSQLKNTTLNWINETQAVEMLADVDMKAGEEVLNSYGDYGAAALLRQYGFVEETPYSKIIITQEEVVATLKKFMEDHEEVNEMLASRRHELKEKDMLQMFVIDMKEKKVPVDLLTCVQVLSMEDTEYWEWKEANCIGLDIEFMDVEQAVYVTQVLVELVEACSVRYWAAPDEGAEGQVVGMVKKLIAEERQVLNRLEGAVRELVLKVSSYVSDEDESGAEVPELEPVCKDSTLENKKRPHDAGGAENSGSPAAKKPKTRAS